MQRRLKPQEQGSKAVGIWIRVSTEDQVRGESPEHHEKRARLYAEAKGWEVRKVYRLDAISGKAVIATPEAQRMLADVKAGLITGLIFSKLARLARNTKELLEFAEIFRNENADLISLQESIDTSSAAGRLFYTMIAAMAEWERSEISERVAASVPIRAKMGKPLGGAAPFGYQWQNRKLVPHPTEAPIRRQLYELFIQHKRVKTVTRLLNEAGHRTRKGKPFNHSAVAWLLTDPTAKGVRRANYTRERAGTKTWEYKAPEDWVVSEVEPIVPAELWDQANAILTEGRHTQRRHGRPAVQVFGGRVVCVCGTKMYMHSKTPKYVCRKCKNKVGAEDLEAVFEEQLKGLLLSPTELASHIADASEAIQSKEKALSALEQETRQVAADMDKTYRLYLADQLTTDGFGRINKPLDNRRRQLEDEIPRLQAELDVMRIQIASQDVIVGQARDLYSHWQDFTTEERHRIVEAVVDRISVSKDEIQISLAYQLPLLTDSANTDGNPPASGGARRCGPRASRPRRAAR